MPVACKFSLPISNMFKTPWCINFLLVDFILEWYFPSIPNNHSYFNTFCCYFLFLLIPTQHHVSSFEEISSCRFGALCFHFLCGLSDSAILLVATAVCSEPCFAALLSNNTFAWLFFFEWDLLSCTRLLHSWKTLDFSKYPVQQYQIVSASHP